MPQLHYYNECNRLYGHRHRWIGYLDADEFLEIVDRPGQSMAEFLHDYEAFGAVGINWIMHNSDGLLDRPPSVRPSFKSCIYDGTDGSDSDNKHIKTFVQTRFYERALSPHDFQLNSSMFTVGEDGKQVVGPWRNPITRNKIALHHYFTKSKAEFEVKINRSNANDAPKDWDICKCALCI